jgi:two-component system response regulator
MNAKTILLAEDNADDEFFTCRALRASEMALDIHVARDGAEALELLLAKDRPALRPDLILLDINMPKLDGIAVLARLRAAPRTRLTPVVMLTSSSRPEDVTRAFAAGANSYLIKPLEPSRLLQLVGDMTRYWLRDNQLPSQ